MEHCAVISNDSNSWVFERLTFASLDQAVALSDQCVGKNLYPRAHLASVIQNPERYFYFLMTPQHEVRGYIYFFLSDLAGMAELSKLSEQQLAAISEKKHPIIGNLQSIGVVQAYRSQKLSDVIMRFFLEKMEFELAADVAFSVLWKIGSYAPLARTMQAANFSYLMDSHLVWYDHLDLVCPHCDGACVCDAAIYYKQLRGGALA